MGACDWLLRFYTIILPVGCVISCKTLWKPRKRHHVTPRVKWTERMDRQMLEYCKLSARNGRFEKPTGAEFYRQFMKVAVGFEECTTDKVVQHMKQMKTTFYQAFQWKNEMQESMDEPTLQRELHKRCKYYDDLTEILADKMKNTENNGFIFNFDEMANGESNSLVEVNLHEPSAEDEAMSDDSITISEVVTIENEDLTDEEELAINEDNDDEDVKIKVAHISGKKSKPNAVQNAFGVLKSTMTERLQLELMRFEWERKLQMRREELENKKLEFEMTKWKEELATKVKFEELKRKHKEWLQKNEDGKLELERMRLEVEREKQKQEFELEKLRLQMQLKNIPST
ncbi:hypothetical protein CHUAL_011582 [Chamberlinius hualienensis]